MLLGNLCLLLMAFSNSVYYLAAKQLVLRYTPMCVAAWAYIVAAACMGLTAGVAVERSRWEVGNGLLFQMWLRAFYTARISMARYSHLHGTCDKRCCRALAGEGLAAVPALTAAPVLFGPHQYGCHGRYVQPHSSFVCSRLKLSLLHQPLSAVYIVAVECDLWEVRAWLLFLHGQLRLLCCESY